ncbi:MAG: hypothetical protein LQ347_000934 [Umbilicaria vellea]|nr:MAG: hypothetical protein LQ347_000934 [Umbilicaria vellea]
MRKLESNVEQERKLGMVALERPDYAAINPAHEVDVSSLVSPTKDDHSASQDQHDENVLATPYPEPDHAEVPLSKNQLKKLKRHQVWEASRVSRKAKRKEKMQEKKERKRAAFEEAASAAGVANLASGDESLENTYEGPKKVLHRRAVQLPITFVIDCDFDDLMLDKERVSLAAQLTRCYSDNHKAPFKAHLAISSFGGKLKDRFENVLSGHHGSWRGVHFLDGDFVEAADQAKQWMKGTPGGKLAGIFAAESHHESAAVAENTEAGEVVYLTSDSPHTLTELKPYSTYIIGGIVDRNRHKGVCYKRAMDRGVKTAKLPIGDYLQMASRFVLATNHVAEIMLRWLELGDWGEAFLHVVPKRKGGVLKEKKASNDKPAGESSPSSNTNSPTQASS